MYKNQLQELAQRSCFNLPSYVCIREGPDHAPRFRASVNFNGETFECPSYCTTLRQAEHAAAEVALNNLSIRGPSRSLAARVLDETGVYKNLLQETSHRAGLKLPAYTTVRSGPGHSPVFTCSVELAGMSFSGESGKTKKQAEKNAAMAAWSALKQMPNLDSLSQQKRESESSEEQEQVVVERLLSNFRPKDESRQPERQRDQLQQRRRLMLGYREGNPGSSHNSSRYRQQWRSSNPSSDVPAGYQALLQHKQSSLLALPPPNGSKILLPLPFLQHSTTAAAAAAQEPLSSKDSSNPSQISSSRSIPIQISSRSQGQIQENPHPIEELEKNEKEWDSERSDIKGKDIAKDPYSIKPINPAFSSTPLPTYTWATHLSTDTTKTQQTPITNRPFRPAPRIYPSVSASSFGHSGPIPIPRMIRSGGFHAPGIAPAVHIRSVIPVCAAPPPPKRPPEEKTVIRKSEQEQEISQAISKLDKLQL